MFRPEGAGVLSDFRKRRAKHVMQAVRLALPRREPYLCRRQNYAEADGQAARLALPRREPYLCRRQNYAEAESQAVRLGGTRLSNLQGLSLTAEKQNLPEHCS